MAAAICAGGGVASMLTPEGHHDPDAWEEQAVVMGEAIDRYASSRRWAPNTRKLNLHTLSVFAEACGVGDTGQVDRVAVERWWRTQSRVCAGTARTRRSTVKCFTQWCAHVGIMAPGVMDSIPVPREPRRAPVTFTDDEVRQLLAVLPDDRAHCIAVMMLGLGLRCIDVARLEVADVDLSRALITIHGKGGRDDILPMPTELVDAVRRYLRHHPTPAGPLIREARWHRGPVSAQRISELFAQWCRDAGVKSRRHDGRGAHALRRTCLTGLLRSGATVTQVQQVARHSSLATTQRYLALSDAEELREVVERRVCA